MRATDQPKSNSRSNEKSMNRQMANVFRANERLELRRPHSHARRPSAYPQPKVAARPQRYTAVGEGMSVGMDTRNKKVWTRALDEV